MQFVDPKLANSMLRDISGSILRIDLISGPEFDQQLVVEI